MHRSNLGRISSTAFSFSAVCMANTPAVGKHNTDCLDAKYETIIAAARAAAPDHDHVVHGRRRPKLGLAFLRPDSTQYQPKGAIQ
jgi:hypothetical protein